MKTKHIISVIFYLSFIVVSAETEVYTTLFAWFQLNGGQAINIEIKEHSPINRYLISKETAEINDTLMFLPEKLILSITNPKIYSLCSNVFDKLTITQNGCLAYYLFLNIQNKSHFFAPFFNYLPMNFSEFPLFYSEEDLAKLINTNIYQQVINKKKEIKEIFNAIQLINLNQKLDYELFKICYSISISRSFKKVMTNAVMVSLGPFIDLMNYDSRNINTYWKYDTDKMGFVIKAIKSIQPNEEIILSYGIINNENLLLNYGYTILYNEFPGNVRIYIDECNCLIKLSRKNHEISKAINHIIKGNYMTVEGHLIRLNILLKIIKEKLEKYPTIQEIKQYKDNNININIIRIIHEEQAILNEFIELITRLIVNITTKNIHDINQMIISDVSLKYCKVIVEVLKLQQTKENLLDL